MKKNKNCELSHMVRPAENLEVYKQKQNILFISGCVEHRRFKVTWASLCGCTRPSAWAYTWPSARARGSVVCMHGRVARGCVCTAEWLGGVYARPSARAYSRARGSAVRDARLGFSLCTTRSRARLGWSRRVHGLVAKHGLFAHGLNFMGMTEPCG